MRRVGGGYICSYCRRLALRPRNSNQRSLTTEVETRTNESKETEVFYEDKVNPIARIRKVYHEIELRSKDSEPPSRTYILQRQILPTDLLRIALNPEARPGVRKRPHTELTEPIVRSREEAESNTIDASSLLAGDKRVAESRTKGRQLRKPSKPYPRLPSGRIKDWKPFADSLERYRKLPIETRIEQLALLSGDEDFEFSQALAMFSLQNREELLAETEQDESQDTLQQMEDFELSHWHPKPKSKHFRSMLSVQMESPHAEEAPDATRSIQREFEVIDEQTGLTEAIEADAAPPEPAKLSAAGAKLAAELRTAKTVEEILRIMDIANKTPEDFLPLHPYLDGALTRCGYSQSPPQILAAFATIISYLSSHGIPPSAQYYETGLKLASKACSIPATQRYLNAYASTSEPMRPELWAKLVQNLVAYALSPRTPCQTDLLRPGNWKQRDVLKILSGWSPAEASPPDHATFRDFLDNGHKIEDSSLYPLYIASLSQFQASELIWAEWVWLQEHTAYFSPRTTRAIRPYFSPETTRADRTTAQKIIRTFLLALLDSHDPRRAWSLLDSLQTNHPTLITPTDYVLLATHPNATSRYHPVSAFHQPLVTTSRLALLSGQFNDFAKTVVEHKLQDVGVMQRQKVRRQLEMWSRGVRHWSGMVTVAHYVRVVETLLGVKWVEGTKEGEGWHIVMRREEMLKSGEALIGVRKTRWEE